MGEFETVKPIEIKENVEKILYELNARLNNIELAVKLHKLINDNLGDSENKISIDNIQYDVTDASFIDEFNIVGTFDFLIFLQKPLTEVVIVKMLSIVDLKYNKKTKVMTLHKIIMIKEHIEILKEIEERYSKARHRMVAHMDPVLLLSGAVKSEKFPIETVLKDIEKLKTILKEVSIEHEIKTYGENFNSENIVNSAKELFKILFALYEIRRIKDKKIS